MIRVYVNVTKSDGAITSKDIANVEASLKSFCDREFDRLCRQETIQDTERWLSTICSDAALILRSCSSARSQLLRALRESGESGSRAVDFILDDDNA